MAFVYRAFFFWCSGAKARGGVGGEDVELPPPQPSPSATPNAPSMQPRVPTRARAQAGHRPATYGTTCTAPAPRRQPSRGCAAPRPGVPSWPAGGERQAGAPCVAAVRVQQSDGHAKRCDPSEQCAGLEHEAHMLVCGGKPVRASPPTSRSTLSQNGSTCTSGPCCCSCCFWSCCCKLSCC
jgi:hypothetical protein